MDLERILSIIHEPDLVIGELKAHGFRLLSHTYCRSRIIDDEFLMISADGKIIVWISLILGEYYIYEKINEPPNTKWERDSFFPPDSDVKAFVSEDPSEVEGNYLFIKIIDETGKTTYYRKIYEDYLP